MAKSETEKKEPKKPFWNVGTVTGQWYIFEQSEWFYREQRGYGGNEHKFSSKNTGDSVMFVNPVVVEHMSDDKSA